MFFRLIHLGLILGLLFSVTSLGSKANGLSVPGVIGFTVGGSSFGANLYNTFGYGLTGYGTAPGLPPAAYASSDSLIQAIEHTSYPATCPSYYGWYSPYGHIGFPCPTCHLNY